MVPEAPTIMPATISAVLFSARPVAAADGPADRQHHHHTEHGRGDQDADDQELGSLAQAYGDRAGDRG
jgi:hypothetical protein